MQPDGRPSSAVDAAVRRVRELIEGGGVPAGGRLPGERAFATRVGVSRSTLRQALIRLADEGLIRPAPQRGWFVGPDVPAEPLSTLRSFTEMAAARGLRATARVLSALTRPATLAEADRLRIAPASPVFELTRLRGLDDVTVCVDRSVILGPVAEPLLGLDLTDRSLYALLQELSGVRITRSAFTVQAVLADPETAELLGVSSAAPILVGDEVGWDQHDRPVLLGRVRYRGDAYQFEATLFRGPDRP